MHTCRYTYNLKRCGSIGTSVQIWDTSAHTCYTCDVCQRPPKQALRDPAKIMMVSLTSRCDHCRYIYNHKRCGRCGTSVRTWDMSARTCYACEVCQPLQKGTILDTKRSKALSAAKDSKVSLILRLSCITSTAVLMLFRLCNALFCSRAPAWTANSASPKHGSGTCISFLGTWWLCCLGLQTLKLSLFRAQSASCPCKYQPL